MSRKLTLIAAGALVAFAIAALPGAASAQEKKLKCEGAGACTYTVSGGESRFSTKGGDTIWCSSVTGSGEVTGLDAERESGTGAVRLLFHGCKEQATIFHFACTSPGQASGTVTTNSMVTHIVIIISPGTFGFLLTGANVTLTCAGGFASTAVTGNALGELDQACGSTGSTVKVNFASSSHGVQSRSEYTGVKYDLEAKTSHSGGGSYETAAQTGTATLTFNQNVVVTC
jgi:hypothetical protein